MTKEELIKAHGTPGIGGIGMQHVKSADISIEYTIGVLEDIQKWWEMGSENYARLTAKITELNNLLQH